MIDLWKWTIAQPERGLGRPPLRIIVCSFTSNSLLSINTAVLHYGFRGLIVFFLFPYSWLLPSFSLEGFISLSPPRLALIPIIALCYRKLGGLKKKRVSVVWVVYWIGFPALCFCLPLFFAPGSYLHIYRGHWGDSKWKQREDKGWAEVREKLGKKGLLGLLHGWLVWVDEWRIDVLSSCMSCFVYFFPMGFGGGLVLLCCIFSCID